MHIYMYRQQLQLDIVGPLGEEVQGLCAGTRPVCHRLGSACRSTDRTTEGCRGAQAMDHLKICVEKKEPGATYTWI